MPDFRATSVAGVPPLNEVVVETLDGPELMAVSGGTMATTQRKSGGTSAVIRLPPGGKEWLPVAPGAVVLPHPRGFVVVESDSSAYVIDASGNTLRQIDPFPFNSGAVQSHLREGTTLALAEASDGIGTKLHLVGLDERDRWVTNPVAGNRDDNGPVSGASVVAADGSLYVVLGTIDDSGQGAMKLGEVARSSLEISWRVFGGVDRVLFDPSGVTASDSWVVVAARDRISLLPLDEDRQLISDSLSGDIPVTEGVSVVTTAASGLVVGWTGSRAAPAEDGHWWALDADRL